MAKQNRKNEEDEGTSGLISITEAARLRGVSHAAIQDLIKRGRLPYVVVGDRRFLRRREVVGFKPEVGGRGHKAGQS